MNYFYEEIMKGRPFDTVEYYKWLIANNIIHPRFKLTQKRCSGLCSDSKYSHLFKQKQQEKHKQRKQNYYWRDPEKSRKYHREYYTKNIKK